MTDLPSPVPICTSCGRKRGAAARRTRVPRDPKVCLPKMVQPDFPRCKFYCVQQCTSKREKNRRTHTHTHTSDTQGPARAHARACARAHAHIQSLLRPDEADLQSDSRCVALFVRFARPRARVWHAACARARVECLSCTRASGCMWLVRCMHCATGRVFEKKKTLRKTDACVAHTHTHTQARTHKYIRARAHTHAHTHTHTRARAHTHTHTHTLTHAPPSRPRPGYRHILPPPAHSEQKLGQPCNNGPRRMTCSHGWVTMNHQRLTANRLSTGESACRGVKSPVHPKRPCRTPAGGIPGAQYRHLSGSPAQTGGRWPPPALSVAAADNS